jgi:hypothetical protein
MMQVLLWHTTSTNSYVMTLPETGYSETGYFENENHKQTIQSLRLKHMNFLPKNFNLEIPIYILESDKTLTTVEVHSAV